MFYLILFNYLTRLSFLVTIKSVIQNWETPFFFFFLLWMTVHTETHILSARTTGSVLFPGEH